VTRPAGYAAAEGAVAHVLLGELGDQATVSGDDGHHLQRVRRIRAGELVTAADGAGLWRRYLVDEVGPGRLALTADGPVHEEPPLEPRRPGNGCGESPGRPRCSAVAPACR
jgi:hypothetical protein